MRRLKGVDSERPVMARDDGPLIGRDDDLAELIESFENSATSVVSVIGEPGLGKSRLLREFATHATIRDAHTVSPTARRISRMCPSGCCHG